MMRPSKENCKNSPEKSRKTITHLLSLAVKREISWKILAPLINEMASSLEKSKEIIKILLIEFENLSLNTQNLLTKNDTPVNDASLDNLVVYKTEESSEFDEDVLVDEANESGIKPQKIQTDPKETNKKILDKSNLQSDDDSFISKAVKVKPEKEDSFLPLKEEYTDPLQISNNDADERLSEANVSEKSLEIGEESSTKKHESNHLVDKPFQCNSCQKCFSRPHSLREHVKIHNGIKPFQCEHCSKDFRTSKEWTQHVRIHTGERPFECKICKKTFVRSQGLKEHETVHTKEKPYQCKVCEKSFTTNSTLRTHKQKHYAEQPFKCETCNKGFAKLHNLKRHERMHSGDKPFTCKHCRKRFAYQSNLVRHEKIHAGERRYHCKSCSKSFKTKSQLMSHIESCKHTIMT